MSAPACIVLIMAGGRGERMRATAGTQIPKPLVPVLGVPLLERNLAMVLAAGWREIYVSVSRQLPEVGQFVQTRGAALARDAGAKVQVLTETEPLGTIGAAAELRGRGSRVLVLNSDNLISFDLIQFVQHHVNTSAAMTIATHVEPFKVPFGELRIVDGRVTAYLEKPSHPIQVSSGTYVLGAEAVDLLPPRQRTDIPWLVDQLLERNAPVMSFAHETSWIDVNDAASLRRAEDLIAAGALGAQKKP
jgi:NDP-sugar pyrophosphorylase family protein